MAIKYQMTSKSPKNLYERLLDGDESALVEIYENYKAEFLNYFKSYDINEESILDIYQDSIIVIYQKFVHKKFELTSSSLKTYLFGIGKNKIYDYFKHKQKNTDVINDIKIKVVDFNLNDEPNLYEKILAKNLKQLSNSCQHILKLFYYRGLSIKDIVNHTDYKDENTVKSHKSRCLKKLKELCNS